jgi:hypothetical protein
MSTTPPVLTSVLALFLLASIVAGLSCSSGDGGAGRTPELPPSVINLSPAARQASPPAGYSNWDDYVEFVRSVLYQSVGAAPQSLSSPPQVTVNPDGSVTVKPGLYPSADGGASEWAGLVPNGRSVTRNADGTLLIQPPLEPRDPDAQPLPPGPITTP